jgi:APA family basic amino acid/polyamine antiporter
MQRAGLGLGSGVGIVVATTVGAGVFVSTGFMAQAMDPAEILLAWLVGAAIALAGTRAYAAVAALVPRSGGEYRYLSDLLHPALGYLAGWASFLLGFSAPIAVDAYAAASYAETVRPGGASATALDPRLGAAVLIVLLTTLHAAGLRSSRWTQDLLAALKSALVIGFVAVGLAFGHNRWPAWTPPQPSPGFPLRPFMSSLFYIAYSFSGWNTAVYAASEFREPKRDVPRALLLGCALVAVAYLLVNWIFVANLTPERAQAALNEERARVTLGHLVTQDLLGEAGARAMSALTFVIFVSAMSAMIFAGPRVYAAMARDGFLPRALAGAEGRPPVTSVLLQGAVALLLLFTHELQQVLENVGAILTLFSALTALSLFRVAWARPDLARPATSSLIAAALYVASAGWMLYFGFRDSTHLLWWVAAVAAAALAAYAVTRSVNMAASFRRPR